MARRKPTTKASRRQRSASIRDPESGDSDALDFEYRCRRCKLIHGWPPGPQVLNLPTVAKLGKRRLWTRCPDDGPDRGFYLVDPRDPTNCRKRCIYDDGSQAIRLCTPVAILQHYKAADGSGSGSTRIGPVLSRQALACEWVLDTLRKRKNPQGEMDLALFPPLKKPSFGSDRRIYRTKDGHWCIVSSLSREFTQWDTRLLKEADAVGTREFLKWSDLLDDLAFADTGEGDPFTAQQNATLHVPVDLREPLDDQWGSIYAWLRTVQNYMLRSVGRKRTRHADHSTRARDAYCYFLHTSKSMSAAQIAAIVFPDEKQPAAATKVRGILSRFRKRLRSEELSEGRER